MARRTSPEADDDFAQIYAYGVLNFGRRMAEAYALEMLDMFDSLAANPRVGRERSEVSPPVRLFPFRSHNILYTIGNGDVMILRVVHGSVNWVDLFRDD